MDKPVFEGARELEEFLRAAVEGAKRPHSRILIGEMGTRYGVSLAVLLPPIDRDEPQGGIDLWRLLRDLESLTAARFQADVIAFPTMEVEITGWVNSKPDETGSDEIGYSISIHHEDDV